MSAFGGGFPGASAPGGVPGGVPGQAVAPIAGFVLQIPADPTWEPFDTTDTLEADGFYCGRISREKVSSDSESKAGVFLTFDLQDTDAQGKRLSKKMMDPKSTTKDSWWVWRSLIRSITGTTEQGKAAFTYTVGCMTGHLVYFRTGAYLDNSGEIRTGVDAFVTQAEWQEAQKAGGARYRWPPKTRNAGGSGAGAVGALPSGLPATFPGAGAGGLPGMPMGGSAPQPGAAPMQQPPQMAAQPTASPFGAPPPAIPTGGPPASPFAPAPGGAPSPFAAAPGASPFGAPPPTGPAPQHVQPVNGSAPQPAMGTFPGFPPIPGTAS